MAERWRIEIADERFERFMRKLRPYEQAVLDAAIRHVLAVEGIDICASEWGKSLGGGLYEFRVRRSLATILARAGVDDADAKGGRVLLRVFCAFEGRRIVLLLGGYDKLRDPSAKRQQREIVAARRALVAWKATQKH